MAWNTGAFDTLAASEALQAAGVRPEQAKAHAAQLQAAATTGDSNSATGADLEALQTALADLKADMIWRLAIIGAVIVAAL